MTEPKELTLPDTAEATIDMLDRSFPLRTFPVDTPHEVLQRHFGARDVIDFLRSLQDVQAGNVFGEEDDE